MPLIDNEESALLPLGVRFVFLAGCSIISSEERSSVDNFNFSVRFEYFRLGLGNGSGTSSSEVIDASSSPTSSVCVPAPYDF